MDKLTEVSLKTFHLFGQTITLSPMVFYMTWFVMALIIVGGVLLCRRLSLVPSAVQGLFELVYEFLEDITVSTLGKKDGPKYVSFIVTIFVFILLSNWIGILPNVLALFGSLIAFFHWLFGDSHVSFVYEGITNMQFVTAPQVWFAFLLDFPGFEEPTKSINTDLALALLVFFVVQGYGIQKKGFLTYIRNFADDPFPMKGPLILLFFLNPFFYLNLLGLVASVVSHAFRLFGNIFGGAMIIVIVSTLLKYILVPVGLFAFFGLFAGLVQAFVFTMLAVTYIQQQQ
eukprot:COSAG01_NODE_713_length_14097_cov_15.136448_4_plen_286_part_00